MCLPPFNRPQKNCDSFSTIRSAYKLLAGPSHLPLLDDMAPKREHGETRDAPPTKRTRSSTHGPPVGTFPSTTNLPDPSQLLQPHFSALLHETSTPSATISISSLHLTSCFSNAVSQADKFQPLGCAPTTSKTDYIPMSSTVSHDTLRRAYCFLVSHSHHQ